MTELVEVTQEDRDVAADLFLAQTKRDPDGPIILGIRRGDNDGFYMVQAFARHRLATTPVGRDDVIEGFFADYDTSDVREIIIRALEQAEETSNSFNLIANEALEALRKLKEKPDGR